MKRDEHRGYFAKAWARACIKGIANVTTFYNCLAILKMSL